MGINLGGIQPLTPTTENQGVQQVQNNKGEMVLNLSKGITLDLSKRLPNLKVIRLGLGWDTISGQKIDLDIFAFATVNGKVVHEQDVIYFNNPQSQGITLSGDNRTGEGDGDDESIIVDFRNLKPEITGISVFANAYDQGVNFGMLKNVYIRLVDEETGKEEAIYVLNKEAGMNNAFHFVDLEVTPSGLKLKTVGQPLNGDINAVLRKYA